MKRLYIVVGTRPNFIKVTQFKNVGKAFPKLEIKIIHTGQHFDASMTDVFFEQLALTPDYFLNIPQASANIQTAEIMIRLENLFADKGAPDMLMVVGDVNSTLAAALTGYKLNLPVIHLESGLRSFDRTMPEEINRILTDEISNYYLVTEQSGMDNLLKEGKPSDKIFFVGNSMIDTLVAFQTEIGNCAVLEKLNIKEGEYVLMTMHRPATVDTQEGLLGLLEIIEVITERSHLVFPIHPRTLKNLDKYGLSERFLANKNVITIPPQDYFSFQKLIQSCKYVITDSGGIQEETTFVGKPCLTLRPNTERPSTCTVGTNTLVPFNVKEVQTWINSIENGSYKKGAIPELWDGLTTNRVLKVVSNILS